MEKNKTPGNSVAGSAVHVGSGGTNRKKRLLIIVGVMLLVAAAAGVGVRYWQQKQSADDPLQSALDKKISAIQDQMLIGDYDKAHERIQKALTDSELSDKEKLGLYMQEAAAYENQQNYTGAIEAYQKAEAIEQSLGVIQAIATAAVRIDNKELAITYYKKALDFLSATNKLSESNKQYFEGLIKDLEGGQPSNE